MTKTNALRMLAAAGVAHRIHEYDTSDGKMDGITVARKIGRNPEQVFKTLVTKGKTTGIHVFVIPVGAELNLKKAATYAHDKSIEMLLSRELEAQTGYIHGGCSPIGMKKAFPTFIEETAMRFETMIVSAGRIGLQMELAPVDLARMTGADFRDLVSPVSRLEL